MRESNVSVCCSSILLAVLLASSAGLAAQSGTNSHGASEVRFAIDDLKTKVDSLLSEHEIPGVGIALVSRDSILWAGGVGLANLETGEPVTENTHFRVGSCTKSFVGLAFLKLVEEGKIDLNTPVSELVPEIKIDNRWKDTDPVRVIHLLEHTSGFDDSHFSSLNEYADPEISLREALAFTANARRVRWRPGTRYAYSNPGYALAGYILERLTGKRYEDYLKGAIFDALGMRTSTCRPTGESMRLLAQGYAGNREIVPYVHIYHPAGSLNSSVREMALFVQCMLNRGKVGERQIVDGTLIDRMGKPTTAIAAKAGLSTGYSFGVRSGFKDGWRVYDHSGGTFGFMSKYSFVKERGLGCVVLANSFNYSGLAAICDLVFAYLLDGASLGPLPSIHLKPAQLKEFTGYYEFASSRQQLVQFLDILLGGITVSLEEDSLYQHEFMSRREVLIPVSPNTFRRQNEPEASIVFTASETGTPVMATTEYYYEKTGSWKPLAYRLPVFAALIMMSSSLVYALFWIPAFAYRKLRRQKVGPGFLRTRVTPLLAVLSIVVGTWAVAGQPLIEVGRMSVGNIAFFTATLLFAGLSLLSLVFSITSLSGPARMLSRLYALAVSIACVGIVLYLGYWHIIGLRMWSY